MPGEEHEPSPHEPPLPPSTDEDLGIPARPLGESPRYRRRNCQDITTQESFHARVIESGLFDAVPPEHADEPWHEVYNRGVIADERGDTDEAIDLFSRAIELSGGHPVCRNNLGVCYLQTRRPQLAIDELRQATEGMPDDPRIRRNYASALALTGRREEAMRIATEHPGDEDPHHLCYLAKLIADSGDLEGAIQLQHRAVELEPADCTLWGNLGALLAQADRMEEAIDAFERSRELDPSDRLPHFNLGQAYTVVGRAHEAEASYRRHLEIDPEHSCAVFQLAELLSSQGRSEEALELLRRYEEMEPGDPDGSCATGIEFTLLDRHDEAETDLRRTLAADPRHDWAVFMLGRLEQNRGNHSRAVGFLAEYLRRDPTNGRARQLLCASLAELGRFDEAIAHARACPESFRPNALDDVAMHLSANDQHARALALTEEVVTLAPDRVWAWGNRGLIAIEADQYALAEQCLRRALELSPDDAITHREIGRALALQGKEEDAHAFFAKAAELAPDDPNAMLLLARVRANLELWNDALAPAQRHLELAGQTSDAHALMAYVLFGLGRYEECLHAARKGHELDPSDPEPLAWCVSALVALKARPREVIRVANQVRAIDPDHPIFDWFSAWPYRLRWSWSYVRDLLFKNLFRTSPSTRSEPRSVGR